MIDNMLVIYDTKYILLNMIEFIRDFYGSKGVENLINYINYYNNESDYNKAALERFLIYRMSARSTSTFIRNADCDSLEIVIKDYKRLYPWLKSFEFREQSYENKYELYNDENIIFRGDTMTSVQTSLKRYLYMKLGVNDLPNNINFEEFIFNNIQYLDISENCANFVSYMHCHGNFLPVPQGFNVGRSNAGRWDYWDLTLDCLYQWYLDNSNEIKNDNDGALEKLFSHSPEKNRIWAIDNCKRWLKMFDGWEDFINQNYLKCWVDSDLKPFTLFENHSFEHPVPETLDELEELFKNASYIAFDRMVEMGAIVSDEE